MKEYVRYLLYQKVLQKYIQIIFILLNYFFTFRKQMTWWQIDDGVIVVARATSVFNFTYNFYYTIFFFEYIAKKMYNGSKVMAIVDRWLLFRGNKYNEWLKYVHRTNCGSWKTLTLWANLSSIKMAKFFWKTCHKMVKWN